MTLQSRRNFIKTCMGLATVSLTPAILTSCTKCAKDANTSNNHNSNFEAAYLKLHRSGELKKRGQKLWERMKSCDLCPRLCRTDRIKGDRGVCKSNAQLEISSFNPHFGEECPLVGTGGSGTVFFTNCSLKCVFCINWEISQGGQGSTRSIEDLAEMMLKLQKMGCHNINVVTPTHYSPHILLALDIAASKGLTAPLVYNTCGWERMEILKVLDGVVDIYLPDFKYWDGEMSIKYSSAAANYPDITKNALIEMNRQVGVAKRVDCRPMKRGLMIRHLVMPNNVAGTLKVIEWVAKNLPHNTYLNIMSQYRPMYKAHKYPDIARGITYKEYDEAIKLAKKLGLTNLDIQGYPGRF